MRSFFVPVLISCFSAPLLAAQDSYQSLVELNAELMELDDSVRGPARDLPMELLAKNQKKIEELRARLRTFGTDGWSVPHRVDYLLVLSRLNELDFGYRVVRPWVRDPAFYLDRVMRLPFTELPLDGPNKENFVKNLEQVPELLRQARENLSEVGRDLARLAVFHLENYDGVGQSEPLRAEPPEGIIGWYRDFHRRALESQPELVPASEKALAAVTGYRDWLRQNLDRFSGASAVGLEHYNWYLKHVRLVPYDTQQIELLSDREWDRARTFYEIERNRNRNGPGAVLATSKQEYEGRVRAAEGHIREFLASRKLLTIPEDVGPMETDAFWREGLKRHFWEEIQYRDAHNNHIHASIPGHRFDILLAGRQVKNPIRSRFRDGGRIEGWAFYIEEMLLQAGLLEDFPGARELFYVAQLARALRIPTELRMQREDLDIDGAVDFMVGRVPLMEENLARYDLEIYLRRPTYGMNYVVGKIQLENLLRERAEDLGAEFEIGRFHDEFLAYGLIPITLIRWEMTGREDEIGPLWAELTR